MTISVQIVPWSKTVVVSVLLVLVVEQGCRLCTELFFGQGKQEEELGINTKIGKAGYVHKCL